MDLDLTNKRWLTPEELLFLVNGIRALWAEDRYIQVTVRAHRQVYLQIKLLTRWADRYDSKTYRRDVRQDMITLIEIPNIADRYWGPVFSGQFRRPEVSS